MFKFQRIISSGFKWTDNLYYEEEFLGTLGLDEEGIWMKIRRQLTIGELNLLIAQLLRDNPKLSLENIEVLPYDAK